MKVLISLALLSLAFANPLKPITLPEAPAPVIEMEMPKAEMPAFEIPDFRPLIIPQEVMEALLAAAPIDTDSLVDAVIVVDHAEEIALPAAEYVDPADVVSVVDDAAEVPLELSPVEDAPVSNDAVIVVDHFDGPEDVAVVDSVNIADVAENADMPEVAYDFEPVPVEETVAEVNYVDTDPVNVEEAVAEVNDVDADPVNVVDVAENVDMPEVAYDFEPVPVEETVAEMNDVVEDPVNVVDVAEDVDMPEVAYNFEPAPVEETVAEVNDVVADAVQMAADSDVVADEDIVKVVDAPIYPGKIYDNPMLRQY